MEWLVSEMTAYYPSLYLRERGFGHLTREKFMIGRMSEARRLARRKPIYPYVWYKYRDTHKFMQPVSQFIYSTLT